MGTKLVRVLVADASNYLNDKTNRKWDQATLMNWLNYAESAVCLVKPDAYSRMASVPLIAGTLQTIPSDAVMPGRLTRNMGADGATPGRIITEMPMAIMDRNETWHTDTAETEIKHFIRIPGDNTHYYVWPKATASPVMQVEMVYPAVPTPLAETNFTTGTVAINLSDSYINPILELMLFRAYDMLSSSNAEMSGKATAALGLATQLITGKMDAEAMTRMRAASDAHDMREPAPQGV